MYESMFLYIEYGKTIYHIVHCWNCKSTVQLHDEYLCRLSASGCISFLNSNIPCCNNPNYHWTWRKVSMNLLNGGNYYGL